MKHAIVFYVAMTIFSFVLIKNRKTSVILSTFAYFLAMIDLLSYKLTGHHIDFFIITRMDMTMVNMAIEIIPKYVYAIIFLSFFVFIVHYYLYKKVRINFYDNKKILVALVLIALIGSYKSHTTKVYIELAKQVGKIYQYSVMNTEEVFDKLNADGKYITSNNILAEAGKNIVIIYCESLENNFLNKELFSKETINLNALCDNGWKSYDNYQCINGSGWTVGALYATQTGFPTFFGTGGNKIFDSIYRSQVTSFASVMKSAGYKNVFLSNCNLDFAGTGNMMEKLGYETFGGEDYRKEIKRTGWGVHDADLFELAKMEYKELADNNEPFNLTLLTVDTHFPRGVPDKRMEADLGEIGSYGKHRFTVASLDYLLGDFIRFIKEQPCGEETIIVILSDHLMMGDVKTTPIVSDLRKNPRRNLLITNRAIKGFEKNDMIGYYDLPDIILGLAEVKHNAKLGKSIIPNMSNKFISENGELFTILNLKLNQ